MDLSKPDFSKAYAFHHGFSFRREPFGGILYHYEGIKPDPRVTFVDHPFLLDLLERVDDQPLEHLIAGVCGHFALPPSEEAVIRDFFATLIARGALVESSPPARPGAMRETENGEGRAPDGASSPPALSTLWRGGIDDAGLARSRTELGRGIRKGMIRHVRPA